MPAVSYDTLVSCDTLRKHIRDSRWRVFDCRYRINDPAAGRKLYQGGHIPDAYFVDVDAELSGSITPRTGRHPLPDRETFTRWLGDYAIGPEVQVVAYDDMGGAIAARLWWLARWAGHEASAVLDGGWAAWRQEGGELSRSVPATPAPILFHPASMAFSEISAREILSDLQSRYRLVDARSEERYAGTTEPIDPVAGHIPGATNRPFRGNLDRSGHFLPSEALRQRFQDLATDGPDRVVHYCGSGVTACHNLLAMECAGLRGSRLYAGSWSEWCRDPNRPVAHGGQ